MTDKELWEWCGFKEAYLPYPNHNKKGWYIPIGQGYVESFEVLPEITLDNLFDYAVPKLGQCALIKNYGNNHGTFWIVQVSLIEKITKASQIIECSDEDPATALRKAIEKVIENG